MEYKKYHRRLRHIISFPFIWLMLVPILILDITIEVYHQICFRLYGIPLVKRANYITLDRRKLAYLRFFDKVSCVYCGYANGLFAYAVEIAGKTEEYWCAIKQPNKPGFVKQPHQKTFLKYGDEKAYKKKYGK